MPSRRRWHVDCPELHLVASDLPLQEKLLHGARNNRWFDIWSLAHVASGVVLGWLINPFWAFAILVAWEPLEIVVLSPLVRRVLNREFGYESWRNSMSDILFDGVGVALGAYVVLPLLGRPF